MTNSSKIPMLLTAYGLPHMMGYLPTKGGESYPTPIGPVALMDAAAELGLSGVEIPLPPSGTISPQALREALEARGQQIVLDSGNLLDNSAEEFRDFLKSAAGVGAKVVRATLSGILCGDRRAFAGGWDPHLLALAKRLNEVLPYAEDLGLCVALENHQDATSADLLRLGELTGHSPAYGVTLDTGNPLAVGEGPLEYAERLALLIRHLHLKDYTIHFAPEGYRLARCAAGEGVVDFPGILNVVRANGHAMLPGIEIAAQATRTIPLLELDWWSCYPETASTALIPALRILWAKGRPADEPYSSAWERGEDSRAVSAEEWSIVRRSADYFCSLS